MIKDYATFNRRAFCATPLADQTAIATARHARRLRHAVQRALARDCDGLSLDDLEDRATLAKWIIRTIPSISGCLFLALLTFSGGAHADKIYIRSIEQARYIRIERSATAGYNKSSVALFSQPVCLGRPAAIEIFANFQVSLRSRSMAMIGHGIVRTPGSGRYSRRVKRTQIPGGDLNGENVTRVVHHKPIQRVAFDRPAPGCWAYHVVAYAAHRDSNGESFIVDRGYGTMIVKVRTNE